MASEIDAAPALSGAGRTAASQVTARVCSAHDVGRHFEMDRPGRPVCMAMKASLMNCGAACGVLIRSAYFSSVRMVAN